MAEDIERNLGMAGGHIALVGFRALLDELQPLLGPEAIERVREKIEGEVTSWDLDPRMREWLLRSFR